MPLGWEAEEGLQVSRVLKDKDFHGRWRQEGYPRMKGKKEQRHERMSGSQEGEEAENNIKEFELHLVGNRKLRKVSREAQSDLFKNKMN